jgi:hypothetical protein
LKDKSTNTKKNLRFPLSDVNIQFVTDKRQVSEPLYSDENYTLNQREFSMDVEGVGYFYASDGKTIEILPYEGVNQASLELYLNGSTYGAILYQRGIMPMHGSCFVFEGKGIMLCGESGAGKSSLTTAFVMDGCEFLTDDVTPIIFPSGNPEIWAMSESVKLWDDSLVQLKQSLNELQQIDPETQKFYFPLQGSERVSFPLDHIILLDVSDDLDPGFEPVTGAEKLTALRQEVYRPEYVLGMPENESKFFSQLANISTNVTVTRLKRPATSPIENTKGRLANYLRELILSH